MKTVSIRIENSTYAKLYDFMTDFDDIKVGDMVVAETVNGLVVGTVKLIANGKSSNATKWIVDKVDVAAHNARREKEKKLADLKKQMDKRRKQVEEMDVYAHLATIDPQMKELLDQFVQLQQS